jgi:peptidoglycan/xylan/chitin deacetylase (PgdA/CDA1 family)
MFVRPRDLRRQIGRLRAWGYELVSFGELARRAAEDRASGRAALTFDDGLVDNLETLVPLLQAEGAPATVFVVTGWLGQSHPAAPWTRLLTESEVREVSRQGVEIGAHTHTHPDLTTLPRARAREELERSRVALQELTGAAVDLAAYPFGNANDDTRAAAREAGLSAACRTLGAGNWQDPFDLPRQAMENRASDLGLWLKREGRYEALMRWYPARVVRKVTRRAKGIVG